MARYYCTVCKLIFFRERPNLNQRCRCGGRAILDWGYAAPPSSSQGKRRR